MPLHDQLDDLLDDDDKPKEPLPLWEDAHTLAKLIIPTPPAVLDGLIRAGEKVVLGGQSKSFKSWAALDLAFCVSHGLPWLDRPTHPGRALLVNLELPRWCIRHRLLDIAHAHDTSLKADQLLCWTLRGTQVSGEDLNKTIAERNPGDLLLIVVDPAYKLLGGRDENSASDIAQLLSYFESLAASTGAAVIVPAHFAKGDPSGKLAMDRVSGSGVFARDPDSLITFTRHEEDDAFTVDSVLRTFPPAKPFVIQWQFPTFSLAPDLDPDKLKKPQRGHDPTYDLSDVLAPLAGQTFTAKEWFEAAHEESGLSESSFFRLKKEAISAGRVRILLVNQNNKNRERRFACTS